jgi:4,5-dihydroxyphthalate decarboxylase
MNRLRLSYAGYPYLDRTRALEVGTVAPPGVELTIQWLEITELFRRAARFAEWDACEMSASTYMMMAGAGEETFVGVPVFPSRAFRHNMILVNGDAGIEAPEDLRGKRVGLEDYQMTAALWIRAFLEHDYGVRPGDINWWYGGMSTPSYRERRVHRPPPGVRVTRIPEDRALEDMFEGGELDALITFEPERVLAVNRGIRRLFPNFRAVETDYLRRTGFFPIMHLVVVRRDVYEANRWIASALLEAFVESKRAGRQRLHDLNALAVSLPWLEDELTRTRELFGGDPFAYGFAANRNVLDAMTRYAFEQGLTPGKLEPEELFAPETLEHPADELPPRPGIVAY